MHNQTFFVRMRGRTIGPISLYKIRQLAMQARVGKSIDVSLDGAQWRKAGDFREIFEASSAAEPLPTVEAAPDGPGSASLVGASWTPSAPAPPYQRWYYTQNGATRGPVDLFTLQQLVANGHIAANEHVIPEGGNTWSQVNTVAAAAPHVGPFEFTSTTNSRHYRRNQRRRRSSYAIPYLIMGALILLLVPIFALSVLGWPGGTSTRQKSKPQAVQASAPAKTQVETASKTANAMSRLADKLEEERQRRALQGRLQRFSDEMDDKVRETDDYIESLTGRRFRRRP